MANIDLINFVRNSYFTHLKEFIQQQHNAAEDSSLNQTNLLNPQNLLALTVERRTYKIIFSKLLEFEKDSVNLEE